MEKITNNGVRIKLVYINNLVHITQVCTVIIMPCFLPNSIPFSQKEKYLKGKVFA